MAAVPPWKSHVIEIPLLVFSPNSDLLQRQGPIAPWVLAFRGSRGAAWTARCHLRGQWPGEGGGGSCPALRTVVLSQGTPAFPDTPRLMGRESARADGRGTAEGHCSPDRQGQLSWLF